MAVSVFRLWDLSDRELDGEMALLRSLAVDWLRVDIFWSAVEPERDRYDWAGTGRVLTAAKKSGLGVIAVVHTTPEWVGSAGDPSTRGAVGADAMAGYARICAAAATEYSGLVDVWELWNEPNLVAFWHPRPDAADYARLVAAASASLRRVAPGAVIISGGLGGATRPADVDDADFLRRAVDHGLLSHVDGIGLHPYPHLLGSRAGRLQQVDHARTLLRERGRGSMPLWGTEVGVPTRGSRALAPSEQARILKIAYEEWDAMPQAAALCWYTLRDAADDEGFGILGRDGERKPALGQLGGVEAQLMPR